MFEVLTQMADRNELPWADSWRMVVAHLVVGYNRGTTWKLKQKQHSNAPCWSKCNFHPKTTVSSKGYHVCWCLLIDWLEHEWQAELTQMIHRLESTTSRCEHCLRSIFRKAEVQTRHCRESKLSLPGIWWNWGWCLLRRGWECESGTYCPCEFPLQLLPYPMVLGLDTGSTSFFMQAWGCQSQRQTLLTDNVLTCLRSTLQRRDSEKHGFFRAACSLMWGVCVWHIQGCWRYPGCLLMFLFNIDRNCNCITKASFLHCKLARWCFKTEFNFEIDARKAVLHVKRFHHLQCSWEMLHSGAHFVPVDSSGSESFRCVCFPESRHMNDPERLGPFWFCTREKGSTPRSRQLTLLVKSSAWVRPFLVNFSLCLSPTSFIHPTTFRLISGMFFLLACPVTDTSMHEAWLETELWCFLKTDLRQTPATNKSTRIDCTDLVARVCTHWPDSACCEKDCARTWTLQKQGKTTSSKILLPFLFKSCSTFGQLIEPATQAKYADSIQKVQFFLPVPFDIYESYGSTSTPEARK